MWRGEEWDGRAVVLLVNVAEALVAGRKPSAALTGAVTPWDAAKIDRLSRSLPDDVAALVGLWGRLDEFEKIAHMGSVLHRWKVKRGYVAQE